MIDSQRLDYYFMSNAKYFPEEQIYFLRQRMEMVDEARFAAIASLELKDPTLMLVVSLLLGGMGIDRFLLGDVGMGVLKLLTGGLCGILTIVDWFCIQRKARELNMQRVMSLL